MCFPPSHSENQRSNTDMLGRYKKAKLDREVSVQNESPFVHSVGNQSRSFASLEHSLTEAGADDCHFWSSPQHEDSFVRLEEEDIESPLRHTDEDRSTCFQSSLLNTCDEPASSCQANFTNDIRRDHRSDKDYFQCPSDVRREKDGSSFAKGTPYKPASNLQDSSIDRQQLTTDRHTVTTDANCQRSESANRAASTTSSKKWWAFVNGITSELSPPG